MNEPTQTPMEGFAAFMAPHSTGANVHTVNKTAHYHAEAIRQSRPDFALMLERMVRAAIATGDWKKLTERLANYW